MNANKRVSKLKDSLVTPDKPMTKKNKDLNSTQIKQNEESAMKAIDEKVEMHKSAGKQIQQVKLL